MNCWSNVEAAVQAERAKIKLLKNATKIKIIDGDL